MRYLAELPWAPDAILFNTHLRWRKESAGHFIVGAGTREVAAEVTLMLDQQDRLLKPSALFTHGALKALVIANEFLEGTLRRHWPLIRPHR